MQTTPWHAPTSPTDAKMFRFSRAELERRWSAVRQHLRANDLQALIVQGYEDKTGGAVKWLTDIPAGYPRTVVFHAEGLMTVVDSGAHGARRISDGDDPDLPGIGQVLSTWAFQTAHYTAGLNAAAVVQEIKHRGYRRIALAGPSLMPHGFLIALTDGLSGVHISDETEFLDSCKAVKSAEEIVEIKAVALTQDTVLAALLEVIHPGMRDFEINAFLDYHLQLMGAERGTYLGRSAPFGQPARVRLSALPGPHRRPR